MAWTMLSSHRVSLVSLVYLICSFLPCHTAAPNEAGWFQVNRPEFCELPALFECIHLMTIKCWSLKQQGRCWGLGRSSSRRHDFSRITDRRRRIRWGSGWAREFAISRFIWSIEGRPQPTPVDERSELHRANAVKRVNPIKQSSERCWYARNDRARHIT